MLAGLSEHIAVLLCCIVFICFKSYRQNVGVCLGWRQSSQLPFALFLNTLIHYPNTAKGESMGLCARHDESFKNPFRVLILWIIGGDCGTLRRIGSRIDTSLSISAKLIKIVPHTTRGCSLIK